jgi:hypothetical protein
MKIRFLFILALLANSLFSQLPCPLKAGEIILPKFRVMGGNDESLNKIKSNNNQVFSLSEGKIVNVLSHDDNSKTLIVRTVDDYFYIYSNLDKIFFKIQDKIERGNLLGLALFDKEEQNYSVQFEYWKKTDPLKVELKCKKPD